MDVVSNVVSGEEEEIKRQLRDFDTIKKELRIRFASLDNIDRHRQQIVLAIGNLLVELQPIYCARYRINPHGGPLPDGVLGFRDWAAREFGRSVNTVAEYMMIARSEKPEQRMQLTPKLVSIGRQVVNAVEDVAGEDNRVVAKVDRAKHLVQHIAAKGYVPPGASVLDRAKADFRALSDPQRVEFLRWVDEWCERHEWSYRSAVAD